MHLEYSVCRTICDVSSNISANCSRLSWLFLSHVPCTLIEIIINLYFNVMLAQCDVVDNE